MSLCVDLLDKLIPDCEALKAPGGVNLRVWITQLSQMDKAAPFTLGTNNDITGITMGVNGSANYLLKPFLSKIYSHLPTFDVEAGDSFNAFNQSIELGLFYSKQQDFNAIEQLVNAEDVVVFVQWNLGKIMCFGFDFGLKCSAAAGGLGQNLQDTTQYRVTLSRPQKTLPKFCNFGATLADNIIYLDGLSETY
jgi:hypothetical protein